MAPRRRRSTVSPMLLAFGRQLRRYREEAGLTQESLGRRANNGRGVTSQYVGQVESGRTRCTREFAETMDRELKAGGRLLALWDDLVLDSAFPTWFDWPSIEAEAVALDSYQCMVVQGLLQTAGYAEALLGDEDAVHARLNRQKILERKSPPPPRLTVLLYEGVLHHEVGSKEVMREQLERLLDSMSSGVTVQIVPDPVPHGGASGSFVVATFEDLNEVAYVETPSRGITLSELGDIHVLKRKFNEIRAAALPVNMSAECIRRVLEQRWA
ncbi:transcriptional regulator, XRE family [Thermomonospora curvata DSM 43183]|uniref:Transcriptional regulator, XRE family n=2 Tax=Thermomonospora curvata TaxID=2020 RepID=D1A4T4_THECD|nr:transcriptional regulator, XRE family [Thermomonospora curvata DSM 43183]